MWDIAARWAACSAAVMLFLVGCGRPQDSPDAAGTGSGALEGLVGCGPHDLVAVAGALSGAGFRTQNEGYGTDLYGIRADGSTVRLTETFGVDGFAVTADAAQAVVIRAVGWPYLDGRTASLLDLATGAERPLAQGYEADGARRLWLQPAVSADGMLAMIKRDVGADGAFSSRLFVGRVDAVDFAAEAVQVGPTLIGQLGGAIKSYGEVAWGPEGQLAVTTIDSDYGWSQDTVSIVNPTTGEFSPLHEFGREEGSVMALYWTADASTLLAMVFGGGAQLFAVPLAGGEPSLLISDRSTGWYAPASPDGSAVLAPGGSFVPPDDPTAEPGVPLQRWERAEDGTYVPTEAIERLGEDSDLYAVNRTAVPRCATS